MAVRRPAPPVETRGGQREESLLAIRAEVLAVLRVASRRGGRAVPPLVRAETLAAPPFPVAAATRSTTAPVTASFPASGTIPRRGSALPSTTVAAALGRTTTRRGRSATQLALASASTSTRARSGATVPWSTSIAATVNRSRIRATWRFGSTSARSTRAVFAAIWSALGASRCPTRRGWPRTSMRTAFAASARCATYVASPLRSARPTRTVDSGVELAAARAAAPGRTSSRCGPTSTNAPSSATISRWTASLATARSPSNTRQLVLRDAVPWKDAESAFPTTISPAMTAGR